MRFHRSSIDSRAIVAIPAHNEENVIEACLAALAVQRDEFGAPISDGKFEILIFANNCTDRTADLVRTYAPRLPHPVRVIEETLPPDRLNAGWARKRAMDLAAVRLTGAAADEGVILTTDADSCVSPTWFAATMRELSAGADCVAGYIDASPREILALGPQFLARGRREDSYLRLIAEIYARCDPRAHDPWPNHRVSSGASLAITMPAYAAIGGLPPQPLGEDVALTAALDRAGFKVRHALDVCVVTSCRFDGRAKGGAADTMRHRHDVPDAPCDDEIAPALHVTRRAICKGMLRRAWGSQYVADVLSRFALPKAVSTDVSDRGVAFEDAWQIICRDSPLLKHVTHLRPSDLPRQIAAAQIIVRYLRSRPNCGKSVRDDRRRRERSIERTVG